jgi:hypothetical protein
MYVSGSLQVCGGSLAMMGIVNSKFNKVKLKTNFFVTKLTYESVNCLKQLKS